MNTETQKPASTPKPQNTNHLSEWREVKLGDVLIFQNGKERPKESGSYKVYGGNGVLGFCNQSNYNHETIIIGRVGAYCGSVYYDNQPIWISDNAMAAIPKGGFNTKFFYYFLKHLNLNSYAEGSSHPLLTQNLLNSLEVFIPLNSKIQTAIAEVLSSLDDKIDLLHHQNKTLEALAETLFRQWFVEEADESWKEGTLDDILTVKGGATPSTDQPSYWNGTINWTSPRDITNLNGLFLFDTERKITELGLSKISSGLLPKGTLLMTSRAPVGVLAFAEIPLAINQGYIAIIANKGYSREFIYLWLKTNIDLIHSYSNGSTFTEISKTAFKTLRLQIPPHDVLSNFQSIVNPLFQKIKSNSKQILTLTQLRDTLLPKLMSGEVRVSVPLI